MKHRIYAFTTAFLILAGICGTAAPAGIRAAAESAYFTDADEPEHEVYGDFWYAENTAGIELLRYTGTKAFVNIPNTIKGKKITEISHALFPDKSIPVKIVIPASYNWGYFEFCASCKNLEEVQILGNPSSLGTAAFADCTSLKRITLPESIGHIDPSSFLNCKCTRHRRIRI